MQITPALISVVVVAVPAGLVGLSMFLNRHFYPKKGVVVLEYLNNMVDEVRVRETQNEAGNECIEVKWGRFWFPSRKKKNLIEKPGATKKDEDSEKPEGEEPIDETDYLNLMRSGFYILASILPGGIRFVKLNLPKDMKDDPISIEDMDWGLHYIEVEPDTNYESGLSFWKENETVFLMLIVFFMMAVILSFYSQGVVGTVVDRLTELTGGTVSSGGAGYAGAFTDIMPQH